MKSAKIRKAKAPRWYIIEGVEKLDSPFLAVYEERVRRNIDRLLTIQPDTSCLRPHVKTSKIRQVQELLIARGITQFKCATIAEAEMLAQAGAADILLAYQPAGPRIGRLLSLIRDYPGSRFSCLVDNNTSARLLSEHSRQQGLDLSAWIDLNTGMDRTGIVPAKAEALFDYCETLGHLRVVGLHAYDGHISETDVVKRKQKCDRAFAPVEKLWRRLEEKSGRVLAVAAGGTPTFPFHARRPGVHCGPGTFIFWDAGYAALFPELKFIWAAVLVTRVISIVDQHTICLDLGYKSVASENPLPRVHFLNVPSAQPYKQSEEHLVVKVNNSSRHRPGDVWYAVPVHICPTVALYDEVNLVRANRVVEQWPVVAASRKISI